MIINLLVFPVAAEVVIVCLFYAAQWRDTVFIYISNRPTHFLHFYRYVSITYFTYYIMLAHEENKNINNDDKKLQKTCIVCEYMTNI